MKSVLRFAAPLAAYAVLGCSGGAKADLQDSTVTVFYVEFAAETFVPVTIETIEKSAQCVFSYEHASYQVGRLSKWFKAGAPAEFASLKVRVKVVGLQEDPLFMDNVGSHRMGSSSAVKLSAAEFEEIQRFFDAESFRNGCDGRPDWR